MTTPFRPPAAILTRLTGLGRAVELISEDVGPVMRESPRELAALNLAIDKHRPSCADDPRFTADGTLPPIDAGEMTETCRGCPIRQPCNDYATAAQPTAGFWAGRKHTR